MSFSTKPNESSVWKSISSSSGIRQTYIIKICWDDSTWRIVDVERVLTSPHDVNTLLNITIPHYFHIKSESLFVFGWLGGFVFFLFVLFWVFVLVFCLFVFLFVSFFCFLVDVFLFFCWFFGGCSFFKRTTLLCHKFHHYDDVIMSAIASQITSLTIVYSIIYSDADQRKHQSSASLAFVQGIHRGPVNSPHKWPVARKMLSFDDVIMTPRFPDRFQSTPTSSAQPAFVKRPLWAHRHFTLHCQSWSMTLIQKNPEFLKYNIWNYNFAKSKQTS